MSLWDIFKPKPAPVEPPKPKPYLFPLVPTFDTPTVNNPAPGTGLNPQWYPDAKTCAALATIFGASGYGPGAIGGVQTESIPRPYLYFPKGTPLRYADDGEVFPCPREIEVAAGPVASCFVRAPEAEFADPVFGTLARRWAWQVITAHVE